MTTQDYHRLTPMADLRKLTVIVEAEAKTNRHLTPGEPLKNGDIYGGADWGFIFAIGSPQVQRPKAGDPCPASAYRYRRPLTPWPGNMPPAINCGAMHAELPHRRRA